MTELLCGYGSDVCGVEDLVVWAGFIVGLMVAWQIRKYSGPVVGAMEKRVNQLEEQNARQQTQLDVMREEVGGARAIQEVNANLAIAVTASRTDHEVIIKAQTEMVVALHRIGLAQDTTAKVLEELLRSSRRV